MRGTEPAGSLYAYKRVQGVDQYDHTVLKSGIVVVVVARGKK